MSIDYTLTLAGRTPIGDVALRALPDGWERSDPARIPPLWWNDCTEALGFVLSVHAGTATYEDAESDDGRWEWEPESSVTVTFSPDKEADSDWVVPNMLAVTRRVLDTGPEDAAFVLNGNWLLLLRTEGHITRTRAEWWASYPGAEL